MSKDLQPKSELRIGDMPTPRYIDVPNQTGTSTRNIGINAFRSDGEEATFLWYHNIYGDLKERRKVASEVAEAMIELDKEAAIGPAVNPLESDPDTGLVKTITGRGLLGFYIETERRYTSLPKPLTDNRLRSMPKNELTVKAEKVLPIAK